MQIQTIATILIHDEIHDLITGDDSEQREVQEYIFISEPSDIEELIAKLDKLFYDKLKNRNDYNIYIEVTIKELKKVLPLLENNKISDVVFVYQN